MSYIFSIETVYWNALQAVQDVTRTMTDEDVDWFIRRLCSNVEEEWRRHPEPESPIVTIDGNDHDLFVGNRDRLFLMGDRIVFSGNPIGDGELRTVNLVLQSDVARLAFRRTRDDFRRHMEERMESMAEGDAR